MADIIKVPLGSSSITYDWKRPSPNEFTFCPKCGLDATLFRSVHIDYESGAEFLCINCKHGFLAFPDIQPADSFDNKIIDHINTATVNGRYKPIGLANESNAPA